MTQNVLKFSNDLLQAYVGIYDLEESPYVEIQIRILKDTPEQRLEVYLEWNGILGYTQRILHITKGGL